MESPGTLIKFGELEHLEQLQDEGLIYMNILPYFWKIEDEELRGDPFDCAIQAIQRGPMITMGLPDGKVVKVCNDYTMKIRPLNPEKINIYCMYALRPHIDGVFPVDKRNQRFGGYALLINPNEFMQRLELYLKSNEILANGDLVEYVNDEHTDKLGPFRKFSRFSYQHEWRLVCHNGSGEPRIIQIGSIQDISVILPFNEVDKQIQIHFEPSN